MTHASTQTLEHIQVEIIVLADDMHAIEQQIAGVLDGFAHMLRPWVKQIHVISEIEQYTQRAESIRANGFVPVVFLALCHLSSQEQETVCKQLAEIDPQIMLVLLDTGQSMMRVDELAMQVLNPHRFMELPKPMTARQWTQMFVSMARMQLSINQKQLTLAQLENADHDQKLIEQLANANVNAGCIMAELEEARDKALSADEAKSHFLANMTHELRTPLSAMMGFADIMRDDVQLGEEHHEFVRCIYNNGQTLLDILDSIILFTQIEAGDMKPSICRVNPLEILNQFCHEKMPLAKNKGLLMRLDVGEDLPLPCEFLLEKKWLLIILNRLVDNAIKFTSHGSVELGIRWRNASSGNQLCFFVTDTGLGIDEAEHQTIFEHFHQADNSSSRTFGGVGLGLSISRKLARRLGGDIQVISEPGKGSCFELVLPCENHCHCEAVI